MKGGAGESCEEEEEEEEKEELKLKLSSGYPIRQ
jgi:hypothetical protein